MMKSLLSSTALASIIFSSILLTACGGGSDEGSGSSTDKPTTLPPVMKPTIKPVEPPIKPVEPPVKPIEPSIKPVDPPVKPVEPVEPSVNPIEPPVISDSKKTVEELRAGLAVDNFLSIQRQGCAIGGYTYDDKLAEISYKHSNYLNHLFSNVNLRGVNPHQEDTYQNYEHVSGPKNPFFMGVTLRDRVKAAKYSESSFSSSENIVRRTQRNFDGIRPAPEDIGISMAKSLLSAPYHLRTLVDPNYVKTGSNVSIYTPLGTDPKTTFGYILTSTGASKRNADPVKLSGISTYPCANTTGTNTALYDEAPDPTKGTGRNLRTDPIGQPIHVKMWRAKSIKVSNIKITDVARKIDIPIELIDYNNDPYKKTNYQLPSNEAFIMPITDHLNSCETGTRKNCGLYGNSKYSVSFDVMVDNKDLQQKSFTFSTGNVNY